MNKPTKRFMIEQELDPRVFKTRPYAHQYEGWKLSKDRTTYAILADMGCGKSKILLDSASFLYTQGKINALVVIAPAGVYRNWIGELETHMAAPYVVYYHRSAKTQKAEAEYQAFRKEPAKLKVLLINTEALSGDTYMKKYSDFVKNNKTMIAVDESTAIKSIKARRTKNTIALGTLALYRRILTGQPITNSPLDLFSQCAFLDKRHLGAFSFTAFRARYAVMRQMKMGTRSFMQVTGYQRIEELQEKLKAFSFRVTKAECLELPPKVYMTREVELTPEQERMYKQMKTLAVLELEGLGTVTATMVMSKLEKLHQILCGHIKAEACGPTMRIPNNRVQAVLDILNEASGKVLVWACYQEDIKMLIEAIEKEFGKGTVAGYYGLTPADEREDVRRRFQDPNDPLRFFIGNPATGKFGLTLSLADLVIYYSNGNNLENRLQSEDRAHRIGSEIHDKITYIDLVTPGTIDERIIKNLKAKESLAESVTRDIENGNWKKWFKEGA